MSYDKMTALLDLAARLPPGLRSDWKTNHFELTSAGEEEEYFWLCLRNLFPNGISARMPCDTEDGQRVGLLMDVAEALKAAEPELLRLLKQREGKT